MPFLHLLSCSILALLLSSAIILEELGWACLKDSKLALYGQVLWTTFCPTEKVVGSIIR